MGFRTYTDRIETLVEEQIRRGMLGVVQSVTTKTSASDQSTNHEANVKLVNTTEELRRVPIHVQHNGHIRVPQEGDFVYVNFMLGDTQKPYIENFAYSNKTPAPLGREGHWRHRFGANDQLFIEAEPADHSGGDAEVIRMGKKPDGLSDPTTTVAIDDSGGTTTVTVECEGDISLSADGDIVIDEGGTATPVAKQNHTHDFQYTGGGDNSSTLTGSTGSPNENGTSVEIE